MIYEHLQVGSNHARTGKELASLLDIDIRTVGAQIERERRSGVPICANMTGDNQGFYLAADTSELYDYRESLKHRADELYKTNEELKRTENLMRAGYTTEDIIKTVRIAETKTQ